MDVTLFLNHRCNMRCAYCYNGEKFARPMSEGVMRKGVEMAFCGPDARICFFGGEPMLEFELLRSAALHARRWEEKHAHQIPVRFSVTCNGTILTDEMLDFLQAERFHYVVSIDGCRQAHEATRPLADGASSFDVILENIDRALLRIGSMETVSVIDPANVELLPESFDFLLGLGVKNLNFSVNYEGDWSEAKLEELESALDGLATRYVEAYRQEADFALDLFDSKIISHLKGGYSCHDRCNFGCDEVTVAPSGRLYPCERLVGEDGGGETCIGHIDSGVDLDRVMEMKRAKDTPDEDCRDCEMQHRCMFWCGCVNHAMTGQIGSTSGLLCHIEQSVVRAADKAAGHLFEEKNPIFVQKFYCAV